MTTTTDHSTDETALRTVIEAWAETLRAKDAEGVVSHHAAGFVQYSLAPPLISTAADAAGLNAWFDTWDGRLGYEIRDLDLTISGDIAFGHCLSRLSGTKVGGDHNEVWFRQTFGFRRVGGTWQFVHQHQSVPFYMDGSYRAAVDLAPGAEPVVA